MDKAKQKLLARNRRHQRVRARVSGTATCPRVAVFRSLRYIYAQAIDDNAGKTLLAASDHKTKAKSRVASAQVVGVKLGELIKAKGIEKIVFDRGGFRYHGRVKALADGLRQAGVQF